MPTVELNRFEAIVIGGGQSGLAAGYYLGRAGSSFLIVDANQRSGDSWRGRWDSLRLFSPAQYDSLPGLPLALPKGTFPGKNALADYLEGYARHFNLPILRGTQVTRVARQARDFIVECGNRTFCCANVIVATGAYSSPLIPDSSALFNPSIQQVHSSGYRRPEDVIGDRVLVVGFGTSGVEIAIELAAAGRRVLLSGRPTAQALSKIVPAIFAGRNPILRLIGRAYWNFMHRVVTIDTALGRKAKSQISLRGQPLIGLNREDALAAGVEHVARLAAVTEGQPYLEDGRTLDISAVVWCTGFRPDYQFLQLAGCPFDGKGLPIAPHGIVRQVPGLYFVGLPFQTGLTSTLVGGAGRDAALVVRRIARQRVVAASGYSVELRESRSCAEVTQVGTLAEHQSAKFAIRKGALAGVMATVTMDCISALVHRLGLTAPLAPDLMGRWFASLLRLRPFLPDIAQSPAVRNEMAIALAGHYAIGVTLACLYTWLTSRLRWRPWQLRCALGYAVCTNALPWLIMFPAMGYGLFGAHGPSSTRLFVSSLCSHTFYGLGLWTAIRVIRAKVF
jgi:putative flavoprotein involved in K+ transport